MNIGNVQGLKLSINCFADVKLKIADVKLKMTNSQRQFFAAMKNSEFQRFRKKLTIPRAQKFMWKKNRGHHCPIFQSGWQLMS